MIFFINKNFLFFFTWLILLSIAFSDPFKDINFDFLEEEIPKPKSTKKSPVKKKKTENSEHPLFMKVLETFDGEIIR